MIGMAEIRLTELSTCYVLENSAWVNEEEPNNLNILQLPEPKQPNSKRK